MYCTAAGDCVLHCSCFTFVCSVHDGCIASANKAPVAAAAAEETESCEVGGPAINMEDAESALMQALISGDARAIELAEEHLKLASKAAKAQESMSPEDDVATLSVLSPEEQAAALSAMSAEEQAAALAVLSPEDQAATLAAMSPEDQAAALAVLSPEEQAAALAVLSPEDQAATLAVLSPEDQAAALSAISEDADAYEKWSQGRAGVDKVAAAAKEEAAATAAAVHQVGVLDAAERSEENDQILSADELAVVKASQQVSD